MMLSVYDNVVLVRNIICCCSPPYATQNALTGCKVCQNYRKGLMVKLSGMNEGVMFARSRSVCEVAHNC